VGFVLLDLKFCVLHFADRCLSFWSFSLALVKKYSQHNEQKTPQKTKDRATLTPLKPWTNSCSSERRGVHAPLVISIQEYETLTLNIQKEKYRARRVKLKTGSELRCFGNDTILISEFWITLKFRQSHTMNL
jgi:hypothetical protein